MPVFALTNTAATNSYILSNKRNLEETKEGEILFVTVIARKQKNYCNRRRDAIAKRSSNIRSTRASRVRQRVCLSSVQFSRSVVSDPFTPGLPVHHQLPEFTQTHVHRVRDAIQPSHPRSSPSPPAPNSSQHQNLFQWVNSSHEVAKVLEFQL